MRPSTEEAIQTGVSYFVIVFVGLFLMLGGAAGVALEYRGQTHTWHAVFFGSVSVFGALVLLIGVARKLGTSVIQTIVVIASPFVPKFGGLRAGDPPLPPPPPPGGNPG